VEGRPKSIRHFGEDHGINMRAGSLARPWGKMFLIDGMFTGEPVGEVEELFESMNELALTASRERYWDNGATSAVFHDWSVFWDCSYVFLEHPTRMSMEAKRS
jgi:hypothetical protein